VEGVATGTACAGDELAGHHLSHGRPGDGQAHEASHAWAELFIEDLGWVGFDPANRVSPDEHYVRVACGRDYHDAAPMRGLHRGGGEETLDVDVRITQGAQGAQ